MNHIKDIFSTHKTKLDLHLYPKWILLIIASGFCIGTISALFLYLLEIITAFKTSTPLLLFGLPIGGFIIGLLYYFYGGDANKGISVIIEEYNYPKKRIPFIMAPLVFVGTLTTHLFGGSVGREGTAVQIGATITDQFSTLFKISNQERKIILAMGVTAGFSAIFGTPLAGTFFGLEILRVKSSKYKYILPCITIAFISHYVCISWGISHTFYGLIQLPELNTSTLLSLLIAGILFGLSAFLFINLTKYWSQILKKTTKFPPLIPLYGGLIFIFLYYIISDERILGLGVPFITESFQTQQDAKLFIYKILFTSLAIGSSFKGGEVTPLFFIGAALGSWLSIYFNLPISFLTALGFVTVFAAATKAPIASIIMGAEIFDYTLIPFLILSVLIAHFTSGKSSIYRSE